jgi:undecaprenyl-diphosphatase
LYSLDVTLFTFLNQTLANPVGDFVWPFITDYDRFLAVRLLLLAAWLWLLFKGGKRGQAAALLLVLVLVCSDQLSSSVIKPLLGRPRPCHSVGGVPVVQQVHLLVPCGGGKSFPSSHAVNNFAVATLFSFFYRRWTWAFFTWATLVAVSRVTVGAHFPSDILGGAVLGAGVAAVVLWIWHTLGRSVAPWLRLTSPADVSHG